MALDSGPSFQRPPLEEVAAGIQFKPLPLRTVDVGAFRAPLADEYPKALDVFPLPPGFETFGATSVPSFPFALSVPAMWRTWLISENDEHLLQIQPDRLIANWRIRPSGGQYPRYAEIRRRFIAASEYLTALARERLDVDVLPNQCDLTYFNKVRVPADAGFADLGLLLRGVDFGPASPWHGGFDEASLALRRVLLDRAGRPFARLNVECGPALAAGQPALRLWSLNLSVRGQPASEAMADVLAFLDMAHDEIVQCFAAITTEQKQAEWGRVR